MNEVLYLCAVQREFDGWWVARVYDVDSCVLQASVSGKTPQDAAMCAGEKIRGLGKRKGFVIVDYVWGFVYERKGEMKQDSYSYVVQKEPDGWWVAYIYDDNRGVLQATVAGKTEKEASKRAEEKIRDLKKGMSIRL